MIQNHSDKTILKGKSSMPSEENFHIAVLIDAENVDPFYADQIFAYAHSLGLVTIREIYGSGISLNEWADPILVNSIHTNFTLRPNRFKNSSDICLVIGAMEILSSSRSAKEEKIDAIVIASSDSDFSPLAIHLRSAGIDVIGMGEPGHINPMWPRACTDFIPLEATGPLMRKRDQAPAGIPAAPNPASVEAAPVPIPSPAVPETPAAPAASPVPAVPQASAPAEKKKEPARIAEAPAKPADTPPEHDKPAKPASPAPKEKQEKPKQEKKQPVKAETAQKKKKEAASDAQSTAKVAPSHTARMKIIRSFVTEQIEKHGGRVKSGELFKALASLPDYKYDQRRSRRNPMDYLDKQYNEWFDFKPGRNGSYWISLKPASPAASDASFPQPEPLSMAAVAEDTVVESSAVTEATVTETTDADTTMAPAVADTNAMDPAVTPPVPKETTSAPSEAVESPAVSAEANDTSARKAPETAEKAESQEPAADTLASRLSSAGIPADHLAKAAEILSKCRNLRDSYNHLRQAFGNETGKKYQEMIKKAGILFSK